MQVLAIDISELEEIIKLKNLQPEGNLILPEKTVFYSKRDLLHFTNMPEHTLLNSKRHHLQLTNLPYQTLLSSN